MRDHCLEPAGDHMILSLDHYQLRILSVSFNEPLAAQERQGIRKYRQGHENQSEKEAFHNV